MLVAVFEIEFEVSVDRFKFNSKNAHFSDSKHCASVEFVYNSAGQKIMSWTNQRALLS